MPFDVNWQDCSKKIITMNLKSPPTWRDFDHAGEQAAQLAESVDHYIFAVIDFCKLSMPRHELPVTHLRRFLRLLPFNVRSVFVIMDGMGVFEQAMINALTNLNSDTRVKTVTTQTEALLFITQEEAAQSVE